MADQKKCQTYICKIAEKGWETVLCTCKDTTPLKSNGKIFVTCINVTLQFFVYMQVHHNTITCWFYFQQGKTMKEQNHCQMILKQIQDWQWQTGLFTINFF